MTRIYEYKIDGTTTIREETEKMWRTLVSNRIIYLKSKARGDKRTNKKTIITEKYIILNKYNRTVVLKKIKNGFNETFKFSDFLTGDVWI